MYKKLILLILLITFNSSYGQKVIMYSEENSNLIDNKVWSITLDKNGGKWLGTSKGLIKFEDEIFFSFDKEKTKIIGNYISPIFSDSKGNIWISFSNPTGLVKFDGENWESFSAEKTQIPNLSIIDIAEDKKGNLYFGGSNGLTKFDGENWKKIPLPKNKYYTIRAIDISEENYIAIGHNKGLLIYKNGDWISYSKDNSELQSYVCSVKFVGNNILYIGYGGNEKGGFSILNGTKWSHINKSNSNFPNNLVRNIEIDNKSNFWMATNNGLAKVSKDKISSIFFREKGNAITDIAIEDNIIWATTLFGFFKIEDNNLD